MAPEDFTCWKVGTTYGSYRKNCTETGESIRNSRAFCHQSGLENLRFLADRGFYPDRYEVNPRPFERCKFLKEFATDSMSSGYLMGAHMQ